MAVFSNRWMRPLLSLGVVVVMLALFEAGLRALAPLPDPYEDVKNPGAINRYIRSEFPPGMVAHTESEEGLPGMGGGVTTFTINERGFRGGPLEIPKPPGEYRVFLMGGSTMEGFYLDDADSVEAVLQRELQAMVGDGRTVKVYNSGKSGEKSDDHLAMYTQRVAHMEPDLLVAVFGFNDYRAAWFDYDYLHYGRGGPFPRPPPLVLGRLVRMMLTEWQLPRHVFYAITSARPSTARETLEVIPLTTNYRDKAALRKSLPTVREKPMMKVAEFRRNVEALVGMTSMQGVALVLGTQGSSWRAPPDSPLHEWHWMQTAPGGRHAYATDVALAGLDEMNDTMREVAARAGVPLFDAAAELAPTTENYYDDVHWNVNGARNAARGIARVVKERGLLGGP